MDLRLFSVRMNLFFSCKAPSPPLAGSTIPLGSTSAGFLTSLNEWQLLPLSHLAILHFSPVEWSVDQIT